MDPFDIETNFNLGLLLLNTGQDINIALGCFETVVSKDDRHPGSEFFTTQFAKSYYNIGVIYDRMGQFLTASNSYKLALEKCREDPKLVTSAIYKKAGTNYAVALEKLNRRAKAFKHLNKMH